MSLIRKHVAVLQAWACLDLVVHRRRTDGRTDVYVILYSVQCICIALGRQLIVIYYYVRTHQITVFIRLLI